MSPFEAPLDPKARLAVEALRPILVAANLPEPDMRQIVITKNSIREFSVYDGLTRAILDHDMPEIPGSTTLDHYTNTTGFKGITASQELWLAQVTFHLSQGELATFAQEHGMQGFIDANGTPKPLLKEAAADLFYTSFTEPVPSEHLW